MNDKKEKKKKKLSNKQLIAIGVCTSLVVFSLPVIAPLIYFKASEPKTKQIQESYKKAFDEIIERTPKVIKFYEIFKDSDFKNQINWEKTREDMIKSIEDKFYVVAFDDPTSTGLRVIINDSNSSFGTSIKFVNYEDSFLGKINNNIIDKYVSPRAQQIAKNNYWKNRSERTVEDYYSFKQIKIDQNHIPEIINQADGSIKFKNVLIHINIWNGVEFLKKDLFIDVIV